MLVAISQRNEYSKNLGYKDVLESNYRTYYESLGINLIPIPNGAKNLNNYFNEISIKAIILTGGGDINPELYGEKSTVDGNYSNLRDKTEIELLNIAVNTNLPVFCICRGMQAMNVFFGGRLIQNLEKEVEGCVGHLEGDHQIKFTNDELCQLIGKRETKVNSYHNQGINPITLSKELKVFAISQEDDIIEGVYHKKYSIVGVQWHPERPNSDKEIDKIIINGVLKRDLFWK